MAKAGRSGSGVCKAQIDICESGNWIQKANSSNGKTIKDFHAFCPGENVTILFHAIIKESIRMRNLSCFVVSAEKSDAIRVSGE